MKHRLLRLTVAWALVLSAPAFATIFGTVRGIVHDPDHRPVAGARVLIRAAASTWSSDTESNADGDFEFSAVSLGEYVITVQASGFSPAEQRIEVLAGTAPVLHFALRVESAKESVQVSAAPVTVGTTSAPSTTLVSRRQIAETPGADRTNSLAMITDFVPGAYVVHDQLHVRGGHQVSWLIDGVPVPNTNIASNVGPQFDPKDVDYIEMQRGGYSADYGDRTYGVFNVVTRSGFERDREVELVTSYGNFNETNDQLSLGSHTERLAYYASLNGNRSDLGLATPTSAVLHDQASGLGGFGSFIFNATPSDQFRLVSSLRRDHYQIPNTPAQQGSGVRDLDRESDAFVNLSWVHTIGPALLLTVSPFYHFNRANYAGGPNGAPVITTDNRASNYVGAQSTLSFLRAKHNARGGVEIFGQHDNALFGLGTPGAPQAGLHQRQASWGNQEAAFLEDQYRAAPWLTLNGGVRLTHYAGLLSENSADPRVGVAIRLPKLGWILHGFYGRYYQPPPLDTVSGPLAELALEQGFKFLPLHGERDEQQQFGATIPFRSWTLDVDHFRTRARNFFDHDVLGNSNIFLPLTIQSALIHGWEATLRSPRLFDRAQVHVAWSHQYAEAWGAVSGGLTDFSPPPTGFFFLDHDQRDTVSAVASTTLPWRAWATATMAYGSGFLDGNGPAHLPAHTTFDVEIGKSIGENWSVALAALNAANRRFLLDNSNTFGGTHYVDPRRLAAEVRYQFHY